MGNIFRIRKTTYFVEVAEEIKYLSCSEEVIKEMGEPIFHRDGRTWLFAYKSKRFAGFMAYEPGVIVYAYTLPEYRGTGVMEALYNELPVWPKTKVVASKDGVRFFSKKGFKVVKEYSICVKMEKNDKVK